MTPRHRWPAALRVAALGAVLAACGLPALAQTVPAQTVPEATSGTVPDIRAHLRARRSTVLSSEVSGTIEAVAVDEGERFQAGAPLVRFECSIHKAQLAKAVAARDGARKTYAVRSQLGRLRSVSALEIDEAATNMAMAEAEERMRRFVVERCVIAAPFAGRAGEVKVKPHQFLAEGKELLEVVDDTDLELEMIVPSRWLVWLKPGQHFAVDLDETGQHYEAQATRLGAAIDPVSQSVKVFGRLTAGTNGLMPGMSGRALFAIPP